jgi:hypothetical protein
MEGRYHAFERAVCDYFTLASAAKSWAASAIAATHIDVICTAPIPMLSDFRARGVPFRPTKLEQTMAREELKWQNIDADDLPAEVKKSFDAMIEAEAAFKADLEKLLKNEGHMPEDKHLLMSRKGKRLGVAFASTPRGEGGAGSLKFKAK